MVCTLTLSAETAVVRRDGVLYAGKQSISRRSMRTRTVVLFFSIVLVSLSLSVQAQQNIPDTPSAKSAQTAGHDSVVEGTVVSTTRHTLVVRSDDDQYHLFTYGTGMVHDEAVKPAARVRVSGTAPDAGGTQVAESVAVLQPGSAAVTSGDSSQAAPPPPQVNQVTNEIEGEARRWHAGGRIGVGFSPEIFLF